MNFLRGGGRGGRGYHQEALDGNEEAPTNQQSGNQVPQNNDVALGRPVGGASASSSSAAAAVNPAPTVVVSGNVVGGAAPAAAAPGQMKLVRCAKCGFGTQAAIGQRVVTCGGCQSTLKADDTPAQRVFCPVCKTTNIVQPGTARIKCGKCTTVLDVPGVAKGVANPQAALREEEDQYVQQAIQASLDDNGPTKPGK
mmetsp:Transcript_68930/g.165432  ORF Transcript_68930/g.165432 Transcript_68930/m.165432 type:complete len:197 (-) Transcript_68930:267-857(-)